MCADPTIYYGAVVIPLTKWTDKQKTEIDLIAKHQQLHQKTSVSFKALCLQRMKKCGYRSYVYLSHLMYNCSQRSKNCPYELILLLSMSWYLMDLTVAVSILASLAKEDIDRVKWCQFYVRTKRNNHIS